MSITYYYNTSDIKKGFLCYFIPGERNIASSEKLNLNLDMTLTYSYYILARVFISLTFIVSLLFCYRSYNPKYLRAFPIYHLLACLIEVIVDLFCAKGKFAFIITSNIPYNLFTIIEFLFFLFFILKQFTQKRYKLIIYIGAIIALSFLSSFLIIQKSLNFSLWKGTMVTTMFYIMAGLLYLLHITRDLPYKNLIKEPSFWIVCGFLFYSAIEATTLPMVLTYMPVTTTGSLYVVINSIAYIILHLLLIKAYTCRIPK